MNTAARLGWYAGGLAVAFGGAFAAADAVVPQSTVDRWTEQAQGHEMGSETSMDPDAGHGGHGAAGSTTSAAVRGVRSAQDGYLLGPVTAPGRAGEAGRLSFRLLDDRGQPLTDYVTEHGKELHLIVVRTDGAQFRHVHPRRDARGTWSLPWSWDAAGTYRVYADFVPASAPHGDAVTLTRTVEVAGAFTPVAATPSRTATVDGFTVELSGDLVAGTSSPLTLTVSREGRPVTTLQPYLGAFGHLVALRQGDLAYLHVHPEGHEPSAGQTSGPDVAFMAEVPTPGRYLLHLDFRVDGTVHSAPFVVDTTPARTP
ncbi:heavy-metal-associated domain-containing protein [Nocardioides marmoribigeumensis]|uniref:Heavy-metal-associated domain-containing protein n=1 Tax=Nocardioides marmoribigeumensis TaxID=433649 RepID=A0ABU2BQD2_9ACTN|nr:heavy-metal-associated domain-containing protein [Nocardioides marmoribigeumensis]MDR7360471.1 hypothetical protein [Nocardioides marmoribigeumensis]